MAQVVLGRHATRGDTHALKVMTLSVPSARRRFLREAEAQARVDHPNVVSILDTFEHRDFPVLVLEFVDGPTLADVLAADALSATEVSEVFRDMVAGVQAAHEAGLVHRDLKPGNVLLATVDGRVTAKIADFGLAKMMMAPESDGAPLTRTGMAMGTPAYMSPEQMRSSKDVDHRTDIYALGAILYEMLSGRPLYAGNELVDVFPLAVASRYTPLEQLVADLPEHVGRAVEGALFADPDRRWRDCDALLAAWSPPESPAVVEPLNASIPKRAGLTAAGTLMGALASVALLWAVSGTWGVQSSGPVFYVVVLLGALGSGIISGFGTTRANNPPWVAGWMLLGLMPLVAGYFGTYIGIGVALNAIESVEPAQQVLFAPRAIRVALLTTQHGGAVSAGLLAMIAWSFALRGDRAPIARGWSAAALVAVGGGGLAVLDINAGSPSVLWVYAVALLNIGACVRISESRTGGGWYRILCLCSTVAATICVTVSDTTAQAIAAFNTHLASDFSGPLATAAAFESLGASPLELHWQWPLLFTSAAVWACLDPFLLRLDKRAALVQAIFLVGALAVLGSQWSSARVQSQSIQASVVPNFIRIASLEQLGVALTDATLNEREQVVGYGQEAPPRFNADWQGAVLVESDDSPPLRAGDQIVTLWSQPVHGAVDLLTRLERCAAEACVPEPGKAEFGVLRREGGTAKLINLTMKVGTDRPK